MFFEQLENIVMDNNVSLHIVGGDLFDRVPSMDELTLYFDFVKNVKCWTIIFDGNHEATRKNKTFFTNLKRVTEELNPHVQIITETHYQDDWAILPYADLHKKKSIEDINVDYLFTHVRGEIPPHVVPEVDLERFDKFKTVFAGDLHAHSNTQRNIVYPGSPMTTSFHRNLVTTGYILIKDNWDWTWHQFDLPQLLRKTVTNPDEMVQTDFHHTIYEIEGDVSDLSNIKNNDLLDKKVIKRKTEATLILDKEMTIEEELNEYLSYILELEENKTKNILGVFSDYAKEADVE
jgi:DNA repair exonuclease SbcCD nuclease subunit|tara:strand:- start:276 stop:1148 length:873 start_codon:yes stop_codon:yes gene_type:complete